MAIDINNSDTTLMNHPSELINFLMFFANHNTTLYSCSTNCFVDDRTINWLHCCSLERQCNVNGRSFQNNRWRRVGLEKNISLLFFCFELTTRLLINFSSRLDCIQYIRGVVIQDFCFPLLDHNTKSCKTTTTTKKTTKKTYNSIHLDVSTCNKMMS
jgi:hypothetical protein